MLVPYALNGCVTVYIILLAELSVESSVSIEDVLIICRNSASATTFSLPGLYLIFAP